MQTPKVMATNSTCQAHPHTGCGEIPRPASLSATRFRPLQLTHLQLIQAIKLMKTGMLSSVHHTFDIPHYKCRWTHHNSQQAGVLEDPCQRFYSQPTVRAWLWVSQFAHYTSPQDIPNYHVAISIPARQPTLDQEPISSPEFLPTRLNHKAKTLSTGYLTFFCIKEIWITSHVRIPLDL